MEFIKAEDGTRLTIKLAANITGISWHRKGDYFTTLQANAAALAQRIAMHQLSKRVTQLPFKKLGGVPRSAAFHPTSPRFVIATERSRACLRFVQASPVTQTLPLRSSHLRSEHSSIRRSHPDLLPRWCRPMVRP